MRNNAGARLHALIDDLETRCGDAVSAAAAMVVDCVAADGVVHTAGAGHSLAMVCETFYRAGGLAPVRPLWDPAILPLTGALASTDAERKAGLGTSVVAAAAPAPPDVAVVFSTSGKNAYPLEVAKACLAREVPVIAVTSLAASTGPDRLADHATLVLDTEVPAGDATYPPDAPRTSPASTILGSYLWALLLAEVDELAAERGVELPRWTSSNVPGGREANSGLLRRYADRIPEL